MLFVRTFSKVARSGLPKAVREQLWLRDVGRKYDTKCAVTWCENEINVFNFIVGHNKPVSKGGTNDLRNLRPICARCNSSMGDRYTIDEWNEAFEL